MAGKAYVCDGAKIECQLCTKPEEEPKPYRIPLLDAIKGPKFELFKA